jgi:transcriptional regulator with XRE-family HTH domain
MAKRNKVRKLRIKLGLEQMVIVRKTGLSQSVISDIELQKRNIKPNESILIAKVLKVHPDDLDDSDP